MKYVIKILMGILITSISFIFFHLSSKAQTPLSPNSPSSILMESTTGVVVYEKEASKRRAPASMTKIMSLKLIFDSYKEGRFTMDNIVTTSDYASSMGGSQIFLSPGEEMKVKDLIKSIAIVSANDATVAMAELISGTEMAFVEMMNKEAQKMGLKDTNFENCTGLTTDNHYTTAHDMAVMARILINTYGEELLPITSTYDSYIREGTPKQFWLVNTNKLVKFVPGIDGLKTGWTEEAGYCLTATMKKDGIRFIAVAMGAETTKKRNSDIVDLLNYGIANYELVNVYQQGYILKTISDVNVSPNPYHLIVPRDINHLKKKGENLGNFSSKITGNMLKIYLDEMLIEEVKLVEKEEIKRANFFEILWQILQQMFG